MAIDASGSARLAFDGTIGREVTFTPPGRQPESKLGLFLSLRVAIGVPATLY